MRWVVQQLLQRIRNKSNFWGIMTYLAINCRGQYFN